MNIRMSIFALGALLLIVMTSATRADATFDDELKALANSERALLNLKVDGSARDEQLNESHRWQPTQLLFDATAWVNGMPGGQAKVFVRREVTRWEGDNVPSPFAEASYIVSWNGKIGTFLELKSGGLGAATDSTRARIYSKAPPELHEADKAWGAPFSIFFGGASGTESLSQAISVQAEMAKKRSDCVCAAVTDTVGKTLAIKLSVTRRGFVEYNWWVDPSRGYALLRSDYHAYKPGGQIANAYLNEVTRLTEAGPGIWYPAEAYCYYPIDDPNHRESVRLHYIASSIVANDPKFDPAVFDTRIPEGYFVVDMDSNKINVSGPTTKELDQELKAAAAEATNAAASSKK